MAGELELGEGGVGLDTDNRQWLYRMLLVLPGFITIGLARYLGDLGDLGDFELTTYSLALSLLIFLIASVLFGLARKLGRRHRHDKLRLFPGLSWGFALTVLALSLVLGVLIAESADSDSGLNAAKYLPGMGWLSKRSSARPLSYFLSLNGDGKLQAIKGIPSLETMAWAEVTVEGGNRFAGFPRLYPKENKRSEIFLMPACLLQGATVTPIAGPGVLVPEDKIESMVFFDRKDCPCSLLWDKLNRRGNPKPVSVPKEHKPCIPAK
jgi:Family of unknown function (DUF6338)